MRQLVAAILLFSTAGSARAAAETATAIAAGRSHTCAITSAGTLLCWGDNFSGQLGDGTRTNRDTPQEVVGLSDVTAVSAGLAHTCAISGDGRLQCWGSNGNGQLGNPDVTTRSTTPVDVVGLSSGVVAVAAGESHTCAVTSAGGVKCWGENDAGEVGTGTTSFDPVETPADVVGLSAGVVSVAAGSWSSCALLATGGIKCWGDNYWGQLGSGTSGQDIPFPVDVVGVVGGTAITAGAMYYCAIADVPETGGLRCWGYNALGQLGDGTTTDRHTPVPVIGLASGVTGVSGSVNHTCAVTGAGVLYCWGNNSAGQIGDGGDTANRLEPALILGPESASFAVGSGGSHTCALTESYAALCWGGNPAGQLGRGGFASSYTPVAVVPEPAFVYSLAAGAALLAALARRRFALSRARGCDPERARE